MILRKILFSFFLNLFFFNTQATILEVNEQHSMVKFSIDYMTVTSVEGQFLKYRGQLDLDQEKNYLKNADLQIVVKSISTNDEKRDNHLKSKDFFSTQKFPDILIHVEKIQLPLNKFVTVPFSITIRDVTKTEMFKVINKGQVKDPWGKASQFIETEGQISRKAYGLLWNRTIEKGGLLLGDTVRITGRFEFQETGKKTPFSRYYVPATEAIDQMAKIKRGESESREQPLIVVPEKEVELLDEKKAPIIVAEKTTVPTNIGFKLVIGFIGFILVSLLCIWMKIKLLKKMKDAHPGQNLFWEILGDSAVLLSVFIYSVVFYQILYP
ncbi:MAG: YceI family protein [Bacteriovoracaceae bacterium]